MKSSPSARPSKAACSRAKSSDVLLLDVTPLIARHRDARRRVRRRLIERNTTIPLEEDRRSSRPPATTSPASTIRRLPGRARDGRATTRRSAQFKLDGHSARRRAACRRSKSTFDIDANGILHVGRQGPRHRQGAVDHYPGFVWFSTEEVEKMTKEAELNAAEDEKRREAVETENQLDRAIRN